jgi:phospholipid/cholesterol/gamma-HCH transport system substrate-binding protein
VYQYSTVPFDVRKEDSPQATGKLTAAGIFRDPIFFFVSNPLLDCPTGMAQLEIKPTPRMRLRVFVLIAAGAVISFVLVYLLAGGEGDFFARRTTLTIYMPDAAGLAAGDEVRLSGIRIGTVQKVALSGMLERRRGVRAEIRILSRYLKDIPQDSQTDVSADTLVGYKFLDIAEGKSPIPIGEDGILQSEPVKEAADRANLMVTVQNNLEQVDHILADLSSPATQTGQLFMNEQLYDTVLSRLQDFDNGLHTVLTPQSDLGKAFYSLELYNTIHDFAGQFDNMLASIQNGEGTAGNLFASDEQYDEILRELTGLRSTLADANAGKGKWGVLLQDDASYRQITHLLSTTDALIVSLNAGEGNTGRLLANAQLYESLNGSLRRMEEFLRDFRENPRKYLRVKPFGK